MAEQKRGIGKKIFTLYTGVWVLVTASMYGFAAFLLAPFSKHLARTVGRSWMFHLFNLCNVHVRAIGTEKLDKSKRYIFIANHQSYLDIPALFCGLPFFLSFIAKKELFQIPFFGWGMTAVGHVWIDRKNARKARESLTRAAATLKRENVSLVLFPEGTRSVDGTVGEFKRGSFALALEAGVPVVPVSIVNTRDVLAKHSWNVNPGTITIVVGEPLLPEKLIDVDKKELAERIRKSVLAGIEEGKKLSM